MIPDTPANPPAPRSKDPGLADLSAGPSNSDDFDDLAPGRLKEEQPIARFQRCESVKAPVTASLAHPGAQGRMFCPDVKTDVPGRPFIDGAELQEKGSVTPLSSRLKNLIFDRPTRSRMRWGAPAAAAAQPDPDASGTGRKYRLEDRLNWCRRHRLDRSAAGGYAIAPRDAPDVPQASCGSSRVHRGAALRARAVHRARRHLPRRASCAPADGAHDTARARLVHLPVDPDVVVVRQSPLPQRCSGSRD